MIIKKYYLYSHRLSSNNNIFYVGVGTKKYGDKDYNRAFDFSKKNRNEYWHSIFSITSKNIYVVIEEEFDTKEECMNAEIKWIKLLGRKDKGLGILCNKTDGGMSSTYDVKKILQYDLKGNFIKVWDSINAVSDFYGVHASGLYYALDREKSTAAGHMWRTFKHNYSENIDPYAHSRAYTVYQYDLDNNLVKTYSSPVEASKATGIGRANILHCLNGTKKRKKAGGFIWAKENGYSLNRI